MHTDRPPVAALDDTGAGATSRPIVVDSIDIYVTYKCGLRCSHCFVGERLELGLDMDYAMLQGIVGSASQWGASEITYLGGEPTQYKRLSDAVKIAQIAGFNARIVTNGHLSFQRFLRRFDGDSLPDISFSIEGSSPSVHDEIRGSGGFSILEASVAMAKEVGARTAGILSVSRQNVGDVEATLRLCDEWGLEEVNVHFVTNRGFAKASSVLNPAEWRSVCDRIHVLSSALQGVTVRLENTFVSLSHQGFSCAVAERSNLMFLPDGRVYHCMMFIDVPDSHSYSWVNGELIPNGAPNESSFVLESDGASCPAIRHVNQGLELASRGKWCIQCIYDKEEIAPGGRTGAC